MKGLTEQGTRFQRSSSRTTGQLSKDIYQVIAFQAVQAAGIQLRFEEAALL